MKTIKRPQWIFLAVLSAVLLAVAVNANLGAAARDDEVRDPVVAGGFYPADPEVLAKEVDKALAEAAPPPIEGRLVALVVPHAGYRYSAGTAAYAYKLIQGASYDTVFVLGVSHRYPLEGVSVYAGKAWKTPLGEVPVDGDMVRSLLACDSLFKFVPEAHQQEHSVEVQIPFLQRCLKGFKIVPMVMSTDSPESIERVGRAIGRLSRGKNVLLVASTDMTHYPSYDDSNRIDNQALQAVKTLDVLKIHGTVDRLELDPGLNPPQGCVFCGKGGLLSIVTAAKYLAADKAFILHHSNSGDTPDVGDKSRVVGYGAIAITATGSASPPIPEQFAKMEDPRVRVKPPEDPLTEEQKKTLLRIAREALTAALKGEEYEPKIDDPKLDEPRGAFVTLTLGGDLRGCIGQFGATDPLYKVVADRTRASALDDPRFWNRRLTLDDLPNVKIDISALTPMVPVKDFSEIEVGRDGLYVRYGAAGGTLLPQVASERGWDTETFLANTCIKANLPVDMWKRGAKFQRYGADVFGE